MIIHPPTREPEKTEMLHNIETQSTKFVVIVDDTNRLVAWSYSYINTINIEIRNTSIENFDTQFDHDPPFDVDFFNPSIIEKIYKILEPTINYREEFGYDADYDADIIIPLG